jgi:GTP-binding protein Era
MMRQRTTTQAHAVLPLQPADLYVLALMTRAGTVSVVGKPNAGKSTLLNRIIGQKLSIISPKPQSTRQRVVGIHTAGDVQMIISDTPGLLDPTYPLQHAMRSIAIQSLGDADVIVYISDALEGPPPDLAEAAQATIPRNASVIEVINKVDSLPAGKREQLRAARPDAHFISAVTGEGVDDLLAAVTEKLPESPFLYPEDDIGTQSTRFFVTELVRETALEQLHEEVPYSIACEIEEFREDRSPWYIRAVIYVERDSQKRILIGHKGTQIRDLGQAARKKIEDLVGERVYLDLWVKVLPNWRRSPRDLKRFGFDLPEGLSK